MPGQVITWYDGKVVPSKEIDGAGATHAMALPLHDAVILGLTSKDDHAGRGAMSLTNASTTHVNSRKCFGPEVLMQLPEGGVFTCPMVMLVATRHISPGEEIVWNYALWD